MCVCVKNVPQPIAEKDSLSCHFKMVANLLQHGPSPLYDGRSPKKSYIFSVIRTATMVAVLRKDCDHGCSPHKNTVT